MVAMIMRDEQKINHRRQLLGILMIEVDAKALLVGLYDIKALATVGSGDVNYDFVWKLCVLAGIAIVSYAIGKFRFQKKDLPL